MTNSYLDQLTSKQSAVRFADEVGSTVRMCVDGVVKDETLYDHTKAQGWMDEIVNKCTTRLTEINPKRKYIVNCTITQNAGAGMHSASACYWDSTADATFTHKLETSALITVCTVYGVGCLGFDK
eukprot:NODE_3971_length_506_cov_82.647702_g3385_i0.p2 GENE.NODE_3971_length_506_cov_82.647702_g3385_i0~~NODE_3971_length_506_cov_82.647702_g3385_i0.p2  ORF type:complete len:125 (-),score=31.54 NODE_3971_length_506_cov_82.647702_g3385_i0:62-436(-)